MDGCGIPPDVTCCPTWDDYAPEVQEQASALAAETFWMLTGYRVGGCPVTIRPCRAGCGGARTWATFQVRSPGGGQFAGVPGGPHVVAGEWVNIGCGCTGQGCGCTSVCEVILPGEASAVTLVLLDGEEVDPDDYRLDPPNRLVATGDQCWPLCQDMAADNDAVGAFAVTYQPGPAWGVADMAAVGRLACEYAKGCTGQPCALPANVTAVSRQGVSLTLSPGAFPNGNTGIREVDDRVARWNPHRLKVPSTVWSPDMNLGRVVR